jgi:beta-galactosidase
LWNGGNRIFATVRLPETEDKKIIAIGWSVYPTLPSWTWPGREGKEMQVEVYAGTEKVRLYLNDKLVGETPTTVEQQRKALFTVAYTPGTLKAVGVNGDREVATSVLQTAGDAVRLRLTTDRDVLQTDGEDLAFVTVEALDAQGRLQPNAAAEIQFTISGPGTMIAVGNGDGTSRETYQGDHRAFFNGRALVVVRTSRTPGSIRLEARVPGMTAGEITIRTEPRGSGAELR